MKNKAYLFSALMFSIIFTCCDKEDPAPEPMASFTIDKEAAVIGDTVSFTNTSKNAISFSWDFGDGSTSGEEHPSHAFMEEGTFAVRLTASGEGGISELSKSVVITPPPYNIIPGESIGDFVLGDNISTHQSKIEETWAQTLMIKLSNGMYMHLVAYLETGIGFFMETNSGTLRSTDVPYAIYVSEPFDGSAEGGITFGSYLADVERVFGEPDLITSTGSYSYLSSLGISFWSDDTETIVEDIYISAPGSEKRAKPDRSIWERQLLGK